MCRRAGVKDEGRGVFTLRIRRALRGPGESLYHINVIYIINCDMKFFISHFVIYITICYTKHRVGELLLRNNRYEIRNNCYVTRRYVTIIQILHNNIYLFKHYTRTFNTVR